MAKKVPPTPGNLAKDRRNKLRLEVEFLKFKKQAHQAAAQSRAARDLIVPLKKLETAVRIGAFGFLFWPDNHKKKRGRR